jgi:protein-L-isoaspartate O-methyltransferase
MTAVSIASWVGLVDRLTADGVLRPQWREAFLAVPRELFIPEMIWRYDGDDLVPLCRAEEPDEWLRRVYGPGHVVTQVDDGSPPGPGERGRVVTSSASRPDIVALMLDAGRVEPGMRVLEIGTGTGYTAALLAHRLGPQNVTTIEVDPSLAEHARTALAGAGYGEVTVITGDGARGHRGGAPFDRVLSTVAAHRVPLEWVAQTRPGGLVLTPWGTAFEPAGLLSLTVGEDGAATGRLVDTTISFMALRAQRIPRATVAEVVRETDVPEVSETGLHASEVCHDDAAFVIGLRLPHCQFEYVPPTSDDGSWWVWFLDRESRSWARFDYQPGADSYLVRQFGPRRLWDELADVYQWWERAGRPRADQWRFTITPDGQRVDLDTTAHQSC